MNYFIIIYATNNSTLFKKNRIFLNLKKDDLEKTMEKDLEKTIKENFLKNNTITINFKIYKKIRNQFENSKEIIFFKDLKEYTKVFAGEQPSETSVVEFDPDSFYKRSQDPNMSNITQDPSNITNMTEEDSFSLNDNDFLIKTIKESNDKKEIQIVQGVKSLICLQKAKNEEIPKIVKSIKGLRDLQKYKQEESPKRDSNTKPLFKDSKNLKKPIEKKTKTIKITISDDRKPKP
jgi:hypothetical protein